MVTPLRGRDELDVAGLERLVEHILAGGVSGLFILGTTGEGPSLSYRLRRELIDRVCKLGTNGCSLYVVRRGRRIQLLFSASHWHINNRRNAELGGVIRVSLYRGGGEQLVGASAARSPGSR